MTSDRTPSLINAEGASDLAYDVVVIGGGVGGLTAAALLAHAGKKVLVVEAEMEPGGFARALHRGPYVFDRADHLIMGCAEESPFGPGPIDSVLRHLGVRDRCEFLRVDDPFHLIHLPDFTLAVPGGREAYLAAHLRHFPGEELGLHHLVDVSAEIYRESLRFPIAPSAFDLLRTPRRFPTLFRYRNATMQQVIDRELTDPRFKIIYAILWPWIGLPPSRASFLIWALMMASYIEDGAYYCKGSFQRLADALAEGLRLAGGELLLGASVTRILTKDRQVRGVVLDNDQQVTASVVLSNVDARATFETLLESDQVSTGFLRRLRQMEPSMSAMALYLATDLDVAALGTQHESTIYDSWDPDEAFAASLAGQVTGIQMVIPTLTDPSLAPPGEHIVHLSTIAPAEVAELSSHSDRTAERMLVLAERVLPGLRDQLTYVEGAGPEATVQFPLHRLGPIYGWAVSPEQAAIKRLPQRTPVKGLYLVGHWTQPGHSIFGVTESGIQAARLVLDASTSRGVLPVGLHTLPIQMMFGTG